MWFSSVLLKRARPSLNNISVHGNCFHGTAILMPFNTNLLILHLLSAVYLTFGRRLVQSENSYSLNTYAFYIKMTLVHL